MRKNLLTLLKKPKSSLPPSPWATWNGSADGAKTIFRNALAVDMNICMLSATTCVVVWEDAGINDTAYACAGTISGVTVSWGTPVEISSGNTSGIERVVGLTATKALAAFYDNANLRGKAVVLSISGNSITVGAETIIDNLNIDELEISALSSTAVIAGYYDQTNLKLKAVILSISGTTITPNTPFIVSSHAGSNHIGLIPISVTQVLAVFSDAANSYYGTAMVLDINGTTISGNSAYVFNTAISSLFKITQIAAGLYAVAYRNAGDSNFPAVQPLSLSGNIISSGAKTRIINLFASDDYFWIAKADSQSVFIAYRNVTDSHLKCVVGTITSSSVTLKTPVDKNAVQSSAISTAYIDDTHVITAFRDHSDNKGKAIISKAS